MAKGNFISMQASRPTENKVGDYYTGFISEILKRGDTEKAARAKALQERKANIGERFKEFKVDPYSTTSNFQDFSNQQFVETAKYIGQMRMMAESDLANSHVYIQRAENARNDYRSMASSFGSKDFIDKANSKQEALANGDVFGNTDNNEQLAMLGYSMPKYQRDEETGRISFYMPKNANEDDGKPLKKMSVGETMALYTTPDQINMLRSNKSNGNNGFMDKQAYDVAKVMADEHSANYDGNITNAQKWFSETRGNQWFDSSFGAYNANNIPTIVNQYHKETFGKGIESEEEYNQAKKGIINYIAALVPTETKRDTKFTAAQLEGQNLSNTDKRLDIANGGSGRRASGSSGDGSMTNGSSAGMSFSASNETVYVQNSGGKGVKQQPMRVLTLPKLKGQPSSNNVFGVTKYRNKQGKIVDAYYVGGYAEDGKIVTTRVSGGELDSYFVKLGYNPTTAKAYLYSQNANQTNPNVPYIGTQAGVYHANKKYESQVLFKTNQSKTSNEDESF